jgi:hypothetical protein
MGKITNTVPFVDEVEEFNDLMNKPNNYEPTIPEKKEWEFVYNFILEELEEYREACERGDIVEVLDALCDITYVATGNGTMLHGLKIKFGPHIKKFKHQIYQKLAQLKKKPKQLWNNAPKSKVKPATIKKSVISILFTDRVTEK